MPETNIDPLKGVTSTQLNQIYQTALEIFQPKGLSMEQITQELCAILRGQMDINCEIGKTLSLTNQQINQWREDGVLADRLAEQLSNLVQQKLQVARHTLDEGGAIHEQ
jgi:hypothetical protein